MSSAAQGQHPRELPRTTAEWVSLGVALVLLAGIIGAVVAIWATSPEVPPRFRVEVGGASAHNGVFYLPVTLVNEGDIAATEVLLEGSLPDGATPETATTTFAVVPGHAEVEATLLFTRDPRQAQVRVVSHQQE